MTDDSGQWPKMRCRKFEFRGGGSNKFYRILTVRFKDATVFVQNWGRIGALGQIKVGRISPTSDAPLKLEEEKRRKGYEIAQDIDADGLSDMVLVMQKSAPVFWKRLRELRQKETELALLFDVVERGGGDRLFEVEQDRLEEVEAKVETEKRELDRRAEESVAGWGEWS